MSNGGDWSIEVAGVAVEASFTLAGLDDEEDMVGFVVLGRLASGEVGADGGR